jgi:hypothetical protein
MMMKIGIVDLDTSHPKNWIPIEREMGHEIVGVYDAGEVHPREYVDAFVKEHALGRVYETPDELAEVCDCAIIHGCNWDTHVAKARPFIEADKAVFIDKPMAGNLRDIQQLKVWARQGKRITGGSSLRYCAEAAEWLAQPVEERGVPHTCFAGCGTDEFNYGIHGYSLLQSVMGSGVRSAQHLHHGAQRLVRIHYQDDRTGLLAIGAVDRSLPFHASIVTNCGVAQFKVDNARIYRSLLSQVLPYLAGDVELPPVTMNELLEIELAALCARVSWLDDDREVAPSDLREDDDGYDGAEFAAGYREARYGAAAGATR